MNVPRQAVVCDALGRTLTFDEPPSRVVSLVPSDTLNVAQIAEVGVLCGRTRYCVEPAVAIDPIPICGGTKDVDLEAVLALKPDLVLANQEENSQKQIEKLIAAGLPVYVSFPCTVLASLDHLRTLARIFFVDPERVEAILRVSSAMAEARAHLVTCEGPRAVFMPVWMEPLMTFDARTFAADILRWAGGRNVFDDRPRRYPLAADLGLAPALDPAKVGDRDTRYPRVTLDEVSLRKPELVLLPDEPHPFTEDDASVFRRLDLPLTVRFVDGKDYFWYGVRVADALGRVRDALR